MTITGAVGTADTQKAKFMVTGKISLKSYKPMIFIKMTINIQNRIWKGDTKANVGV